MSILREKFPIIPFMDRSVDIQFEVDACRDLNQIVVEWKSTTEDEPVEREIEPVKAGCSRVCAKQPTLAEVLAEPPTFDPPLFDPDASALDAMEPPSAAPQELGNFEDHF